VAIASVAKKCDTCIGLFAGRKNCRVGEKGITRIGHAYNHLRENDAPCGKHIATATYPNPEDIKRKRAPPGRRLERGPAS